MIVIVEILVPIIINGIETNYIVGNYGTVKNVKTRKVLKSQRFHNGREYVNIYVNGIMHHRLISRLVAIAFKDNPNNYPVVNHLDGNILNNFEDNLEWTTHQGNTQHALETGLITAKGESSHLNKYSEDLVITICEELMIGKTPKEISLEFGLSQSYVTELRDKKMWRHITNQYDFPKKKEFNYSSKHPIELKEKITTLVNLGKKNKEIREELNLPNTKSIKGVIDRIRAKNR